MSEEDTNQQKVIIVDKESIEVRRLYEENKRILETEQKQKDIILAEKQKIESEIADKNILLSVSRNYKNWFREREYRS